MGKVMVTPPRGAESTRIGPGVWRKHALPFTSFRNPKNPDQLVVVDKAFAAKLKENFDAGVRDVVPVPAKGAGGHVDHEDPGFDPNDWRFNRGSTMGLEVHPEKGVFVTIKVDEEADKAIADGLLQGVSLSFDPDYMDPIRGRSFGPTLRHTALTNIPAMHGLDGFERAVSLGEGSGADEIIELAEVGSPAPAKEDEMTLEELKAALKKEHKIDVDKLLADDESLRVSASRGERLSGIIKAAGIELSEDAEGMIDDAVVAAAEAKAAEQAKAATESVTLAEEVKGLRKEIDDVKAKARKDAAEAKVKPYLAKGLVAEADREKVVQLCEQFPEEGGLGETFLKGLSGNVLLTELGASRTEDEPAGDPKPNGNVDLSEAESKEVERLAAMAAAQSGRKSE